MKKKTNQQSNLLRYIYDWITIYLPKQRVESAHTQKSYKMSIKLFLDFLDSKNIGVVEYKYFTPEFLQEWVQWMLDKRKNSPQTCNARIAAMKSFLKYVGLRDTTLRSMYYDAQEYLKPVKCFKRHVTGMSRDAIKALFSIPDQSKKGIRDLAFMALLYGAALRIDEILSIQLKDLHLEGEAPFVTILGKGNKIRTPYLMKGIVSHLNWYITVYHNDNPSQDDYLFYSPCGHQKAKLSQECMRKRIRQIACVAHEKCSDVPLDIHPHQFRHARAQHMLDDGINIAELSKYLGHSNIETTMVYLDISLEQMKKALAKLEEESNLSPQTKRWKNAGNEIAMLRQSLGF